MPIRTALGNLSMRVVAPPRAKWTDADRRAAHLFMDLLISVLDGDIAQLHGLASRVRSCKLFGRPLVNYPAKLQNDEQSERIFGFIKRKPTRTFLVRPIHFAAMLGDVAICKLLVEECGATLLCGGPWDLIVWTCDDDLVPFDVAVESRQEQVARYILLKSGFVIPDILLVDWMMPTCFTVGLLHSLDTGAARVCHTPSSSMFNDRDGERGPHRGYTNRVRDALDKHGLGAPLGDKVVTRQQALDAIYAELGPEHFPDLSMLHPDRRRLATLLRFRHAHDAQRDARLAVVAASEGRPLELAKRLRLGHLAGCMERKYKRSDDGLAGTEGLQTLEELARERGHEECAIVVTEWDWQEEYRQRRIAVRNGAPANKPVTDEDVEKYRMKQREQREAERARQREQLQAAGSGHDG